MDSNVVNSLSDFIDIFKVSMKSSFEEPNIRLYFRGENADFGDTTCLPSIFREKLRTPDVKNIEQDIYYRFLRRYPEEFVNMSNLDVLTKMQHFGVPTRLLDITTNPLVALFFSCYSSSDDYSRDGFFYAFKADKTNILSFDSDKALLLSTFPKVNFKVLRDIEEYIECNSHIPITPEIIEDNDEALIGVKINNDIRYSLRKYIYECERERSAFHKNHRVNPQHLIQIYYVKPQFFNIRMKLQNSLFMLFGVSHSPSLQDVNHYKNKIDQKNLIVFRVPHDLKKKILSELKFIAGISYSSLFGDLTSALKENKNSLYHDFIDRK